MYIPGRNRTGSRPSRTVMSLAVYEASVIKKALQAGHFYNSVSLSEKAAVRAGFQARCSGSCNDFAQIFILDRRGEALPLAAVLFRRHRRGFFVPQGRLRRRLGEAAW